MTSPAQPNSPKDPCPGNEPKANHQEAEKGAKALPDRFIVQADSHKDPAALRDLFTAICDETATVDQFQAFEEALQEDVQTVDYFARFMQMHVLLQHKFTPPPEEPAASSTGLSAPVSDLFSSTQPDQIGFFSSGWLVAYLVATVVFTVGFLVGAFVPRSDPAQLAQHVSAVPDDELGSASREPFVARVTAMVACRWPVGGMRDAGDAGRRNANQKLLVVLGDKIVLSSGLMEITYNTGAQVILQGPVAYEVDSEKGGYLSVGRLTARVEKRGEARAEREAVAGDPRPVVSASTNPKSQISNSPSPAPLFAIRTPTATVTDLGTEFGVDVNKEGATISHVFVGLVELKPTIGGRQGEAIRLGENESAQVDKDGGQTLTAQRIEAKPERFRRQMPSRPQKELLHDTFDNTAEANRDASGEYGLNGDLPVRQHGSCRSVFYMRGGEFVTYPWWVQVGPASASQSGKLNLIASYGKSGWLASNRSFPRDVSVSIMAEPVVSHILDINSPLEVREQDLKNYDSWVAIGVRGRGGWFDNKALPKATDAGAVLLIRASGKWSYYENGESVADGSVPAKPCYHVSMRVEGDQLAASIDDSVMNLNPGGSGTNRTLRGWAAETKVNHISLGSGNVIDPVDPALQAKWTGVDCSLVDDLIVTPILSKESAVP